MRRALLKRRCWSFTAGIFIQYLRTLGQVFLSFLDYGHSMDSVFFKSTLSNLVLAPEYETCRDRSICGMLCVLLVRARYVQVEQAKIRCGLLHQSREGLCQWLWEENQSLGFRREGKYRTVFSGEVADIEEYCADLTNALRFAQLGLDIGELGKAEMDIRLVSSGTPLQNSKLNNKSGQKLERGSFSETRRSPNKWHDA